MLREQIFRKMKTWNTVFIVFGIIGLAFSVFGLVSGAILIPDYFSINMIETVISLVMLVVTIYTVVVAIKNNKIIAEEKEVNVIPYILTLMMQAYSIVMGVVSIFNGSIEANLSMNGLDNVSTADTKMLLTIGMITAVVTLAISALVGILPSLRVLMLNGKAKKIEEVNDYNDEEE
ncbi:hypothetical protein LJC13_02185 [Peptostreptococcaceae bacterium OttesenSCG-928-C18]|nr:hypothetical protein [Peptostreptococcaceae bacterium OttesenSCG-928-C18]